MITGTVLRSVCIVLQRNYIEDVLLNIFIIFCQVDYNILASECQVLAFFLPEAPTEVLQIFDEAAKVHNNIQSSINQSSIYLSLVNLLSSVADPALNSYCKNK